MKRKLLVLLPLSLTVALLLAWPGRSQGSTTYFYVVRAVDANGFQSLPSNETSVTPSSTKHTVALTWTASVPGGDAAVGYFVYRGTAAGAESATPLNASAVTTATYTDAFSIPNAPTGLAGVSE